MVTDTKIKTETRVKVPKWLKDRISRFGRGKSPIFLEHGNAFVHLGFGIVCLQLVCISQGITQRSSFYTWRRISSSCGKMVSRRTWRLLCRGVRTTCWALAAFYGTTGILSWKVRCKSKVRILSFFHCDTLSGCKGKNMKALISEQRIYILWT